MHRAVAALAILMPVAAAAQATPPDCAGEITVEGRGAVSAVPDLLTVGFDAEAEAENPAEAFSEAARRTQAVLDALRESGVAEGDLATSGVSLGPMRERPDRDAPPETVGWRASSSLTATLRDLSGFGETVDAAVAAGATGLGSVSLEVSDAEAKLGEARAAAVRDALAKAEAMAGAAELSLGPVLALVEAGAETPRPTPFRAMAMAEGADSMPVAPGERRLEARVSLTAALCPAT
ncbi:MAG: SIMPL domain-containing protein [Paracoccaceae bacterium]